jgi:hypothetical protein
MVYVSYNIYATSFNLSLKRFEELKMILENGTLMVLSVRHEVFSYIIKDLLTFGIKFYTLTDITGSNYGKQI